MAFTLSYAKQKQNFIYEIDTYDNVDDSYFGDIRFNKMLNDENLFTFGLDYKDEKMRSESSFFANPAVNKDDFDSSRAEVYIQNTYMLSEDTEIALALRSYKLADDVGDDSKQKASEVSSYYTVDTKLTKEINKNFSLYAGVKNIFDYTQVENGESPLFYDVDGGFDTAYIYAPLRGREYVFGAKATF
jgi:outer membrane receptor for ferrienterochelin and colicin